MNVQGELIYLKEGEEPPDGFVRLPDLEDLLERERARREAMKRLDEITREFAAVQAARG